MSAPERDTLTILEGRSPDWNSGVYTRSWTCWRWMPGFLFRPYSLSPGEQVKVLLAALFLREGAFFCWTEPINHLDLEGRRVVSRYLSRKSGFLLVSPDRAFLDGCVDHIMVINKRDIEVRQGRLLGLVAGQAGPGRLGAGRECPAEAGEIGRLEDAARRTASWSDRVEAAKRGCRNSDSPPTAGYLGHKAQKMRRSKAVRPADGGGGARPASEEHRTGRALSSAPWSTPSAVCWRPGSWHRLRAGPCAVLSPSPWSGGNGWLWWGGTALESPACSGWRWVRIPTRDFSLASGLVVSLRAPGRLLPAGQPGPIRAAL